MDITVEATITYTGLLKALKLETISGYVDAGGGAVAPNHEIELGEVEVDARDAAIALDNIGFGWDVAGPYSAPPEGQLADWIEALLAGDRRTALAMVSGVFEDDGSRAVCERVLLSSQRRAA